MQHTWALWPLLAACVLAACGGGSSNGGGAGSAAPEPAPTAVLRQDVGVVSDAEAALMAVDAGAHTVVYRGTGTYRAGDVLLVGAVAWKIAAITPGTGQQTFSVVAPTLPEVFQRLVLSGSVQVPSQALAAAAPAAEPGVLGKGALAYGTDVPFDSGVAVRVSGTASDLEADYALDFDLDSWRATGKVRKALLEVRGRLSATATVTAVTPVAGARLRLPMGRAIVPVTAAGAAFELVIPFEVDVEVVSDSPLDIASARIDTPFVLGYDVGVTKDGVTTGRTQWSTAGSAWQLATPAGFFNQFQSSVLNGPPDQPEPRLKFAAMQVVSPQLRALGEVVTLGLAHGFGAQEAVAVQATRASATNTLCASATASQVARTHALVAYEADGLDALTRRAAVADVVPAIDGDVFEAREVLSRYDPPADCADLDAIAVDPETQVVGPGYVLTFSHVVANRDTVFPELADLTCPHTGTWYDTLAGITTTYQSCDVQWQAFVSARCDGPSCDGYWRGLVVLVGGPCEATRNAVTVDPLSGAVSVSPIVTPVGKPRRVPLLVAGTLWRGRSVQITDAAPLTVPLAGTPPPGMREAAERLSMRCTYSIWQGRVSGASVLLKTRTVSGGF